jgi:hypothetical protein
MADQKLSQLDQAALPLTGTELAYVVQSGAQKRTTAAALAALAAPTNLSYDAATRLLSSSTGADETLPLATTTAAGLMSAADKALVGEAFIVTIEVRNNTGAEIPAGAACREVGSSGDLPTVALASASDEVGSSKTLGLARTAIPNNSTGRLITLGRLEGINTSGLTEGATFWLGTTPGSLTTTRPTQPAHGVVMGLVIRSGPGGSGILFVRVANGQELEELHDVLITGAPPAAGAPRPVLAWSPDGLWRDVLLSPADVSGLGTAATLNHGTSPGNVVQLNPTTGRLPAVDGSQLTNLPGGATPAGIATEIQYRNAGALGAVPGSAVDGTTGAVTLARLLLSANGAASASPLNLNGAWFTGGTSTNNFPQLLISPTSATLPALNTAGTGAIINAPSGFTGEIFWAGVNGSARFALAANGSATFLGAVASGGTVLTGDIFGGLRLASQSPVGWGNVNNVTGGSPDTRLWRSDVGVIDQKSNPVDPFSGSTPSAAHPHAQSYRIFNYQVSSTNFECASIGWQRGSSDAVFTGSITAAGLLTVTAVTSGTIAVNQIITGTGVPAGTRIVSLGTGSGGTGTYNVSTNVAVSSTTITGGAPVLRISAEKGTGGGTARDMELQTDGVTRMTIKASGAIIFPALPTTNPGVTGQLWNDGGTLKIA